jgi:hypothetical protein
VFSPRKCWSNQPLYAYTLVLHWHLICCKLCVSFIRLYTYNRNRLVTASQYILVVSLYWLQPASFLLSSFYYVSLLTVTVTTEAAELKRFRWAGGGAGISHRAYSDECYRTAMFLWPIFKTANLFATLKRIFIINGFHFYFYISTRAILRRRRIQRYVHATSTRLSRVAVLLYGRDDL